MSLDASGTFHSYLQALLNGGDFGRYFSDDVAWTTMETGDQIHGREAVRDYILALHTQLFDAHPEVKSVTIGDATAVLEADFVGTHTGEFAGIPPTGAALWRSRSSRYIPVGPMVTQLQTAAAAEAQ